MCGKTIATLQRNVLNDLFDIVGPKNYKWISRQQGELQVFHRRIYCVGANNEDSESKIRGATVAGAYCDEANLYPESFFNQLMARMSVKGAQCFCNLNPDSPFHWFYTGYIMNEDIENKKIWHFTMDDNPNLDEEYVKSLKQMYSGLFYRRFIDGEWCIAEGAIYDMFTPERHVRGAPTEVVSGVTVPKIPWRYIVSCDYGTSTVMSWSKIAVYQDGHCHKVEEFYYNAVTERKQKTDREFGDLFTKFVSSIPYGKLFGIYCDPSAASWKAELRYRGFVVTDADNDVINGIRFVGSLLQADMYTISPSCAETIKEYPSYAWDGDAQKMGIDKPIKVHDHAVDSDRYALYTYQGFSRSGTYGRKGG